MAKDVSDRQKYRIFYDSNYRGDYLDFTEDITAGSDEEALKKAKEFIKRKNDERKESTRRELIKNGVPNAENFSDEKLLAGDEFVLTGVSRVTETLVQVKKDQLNPISINS